MDKDKSSARITNPISVSLQIDTKKQPSIIPQSTARPPKSPFRSKDTISSIRVSNKGLESQRRPSAPLLSASVKQISTPEDVSETHPKRSNSISSVASSLMLPHGSFSLASATLTGSIYAETNSSQSSVITIDTEAITEQKKHHHGSLDDYNKKLFIKEDNGSVVKAYV